MLQKTMGLKQKKNLKPIKGNSFSALQFDYLNQVALDANIKIGFDNDENEKLIKKLVHMEKKQYDSFVNDNPDMVLPASLDVEIDMPVESFEDRASKDVVTTLDNSFKETGTSGLWTEVVKRGRNRKKINDNYG
jgi:hypothetical protein